MDTINDRIEKIVDKIPDLTAGQIYWLDRVISIFDAPHEFKIFESDLVDRSTLENFGDALRIHHSFSAEAFTKDKFEYVLENVLKMSGQHAELAAKGNRGHDITINNQRISLKTQADKNIKTDRIWISKFMELGKGKWGDDPSDLEGLLDSYLEHLNQYDRVLTLRALKKAPNWLYELVEIPTGLLMQAKNGHLEMKLASRQFPKPGYCHVESPTGQVSFQLYFDGGSERKLQIKNLSKDLCSVHGIWSFSIPEE